MRNNRIVILHVFSDGLIFSKVADNYDSMEKVENLYYFYSSDKNFHLRNIKDDRVRIINDFHEYVGYFSNSEIDVILFYSLPFHYYYLFDYIDDSKYVIWWAWGYDIYYGQGKYPPLIPQGELYMPLTKQYIESHRTQVKASMLHRFISKALHIPAVVFSFLGRGDNTLLQRPRRSQKEILARINSFYSPLDIEYDLMKEFQTSFAATKNPGIAKFHNYPLCLRKEVGNVLINHSLTYTDNHLDVFDALKGVQLEVERKFIIPISYGINGFGGNPETLIKESSLDINKVQWLTKVLPQDEYEELFGTVSHAIFGALRQQALGNIYLCLRSGIKVYLFENSILYGELRKKGFILFTIEKDLNEESLSNCLSESDAITNHDVYMKLLKSNSPDHLQAFLDDVISRN